MVALGSTEEHEREDKTDYCGDESNQDESRENTADSSLESASRDCLTCLDTEEVTIRTTGKRFKKKFQASSSITRGCLWYEAQQKQIVDSHQAVWGTDHEIIQTEQELTLEEDHTSFEVNKMTIRTDQLLQIKEATHLKTHWWESQAKVHGWKKTLMQSLKQFHTCFYQLSEKGTT